MYKRQLSCTLTFSVQDREAWDAEFPALLRMFNSVGATSRAEHVYEWRADRFGSFWRVVVEAKTDDIMLAASYTTLAAPKRFMPPPTVVHPGGRRMVSEKAATAVTPVGTKHAVIVSKTDEQASSIFGPQHVTTVRLVSRPEDRNYQASTDPVNPVSFKGPKAYAKLSSVGGRAQ